MQKIATIVFKIVMWILLVLLLWVTFGCGGKKKLVQKSEFSTEIAVVEKVNETKETEKQEDFQTVTEKETEKTKEAENFTAEIEDPSKPASVKKTEKDGETKWELENIKNFNAGKEKEKEKTKDSLGQNLSKNDKSKNIKNSEKDLALKSSGSEEVINKEKSYTIPWWLWVILAIAVIVYIWLSRIKKTYLPWKWLS